MKKIAVGDLGEFWYGDYKEPFEQLEGAVPGYPVGVVLKDDKGALLCAYCGKTFRNLGLHASKSHGLSARDYKREVGLLQGSALVSEDLRLERIRIGLRNTPDQNYLVHRGMGASAARHAYTPERLNKTGRCYAQVLATGRAVLKEHGRINQPLMARRGIYQTLISHYFGDWDNFRQAVGGEPLRISFNWTTSALRDALGQLAARLARTPALSDLRRYGLPSGSTYVRRFGTWARACKAAGVDPNLPIPDGRSLDIQVLVAYAVSGHLGRTAAHVGIGRTHAGTILQKYGAPLPLYVGVGTSTANRREWAADMARRLAGQGEYASA